ncbi:unnamed protein product, partial [marine sediment metagenome]
KNFEQEVNDLRSGLNSLKKTSEEAKDRRISDKALKLIPVQEARIDFFIKGYNVRNRELSDQRELVAEDGLDNIYDKIDKLEIVDDDIQSELMSDDKIMESVPS